MSTLNVGAMAARLGLDPSEFLDKMKGVEGFNSGLNQRMSAEMKRTSREGAESFRLIDEALGIHVSRPLTRLLTSEFPAFAKGLQSILGIGAVGAIAAIGFETWEHITAGIEKAKRAMEEFHAATLKVQDVVENAADAWASKIAQLEGKNSLAAVASEGAAEARHQIDELGKAIDEVYKKLAATESITVKIGNFFTEPLTTPHGKAVAQNQKNLDELRRKIDQALRADQNNGTTDAMKEIGVEIADNTIKAERLKKAMAANQSDPFAHPGLLTGPEQLEGLTAQRDFLDKSQQDESGREKFQGLKDAKDAAEAAKKAIHDAQEEMKTWNEENNRAHEAWLKLNAEIDKSLEKLNSERFKSGPRETFASLMPAPQVAPPPGAPMLPDQTELAKVTADKNESWKKAGEILASIETPAQKYAAGLATIRELQADGRLTAAQVAQATQLLNEQMLKAADGVHKLQEEMMRLLERSDSAKDGLKAFWLQMQINGAENGKFAFGFATTMFKDFEDGIAKTILATSQQHTQLKKMWESYFKGLEEMALKFALSKSFASLANLAAPNAGGASSGLAGLLAKLFGSGAGGGGATAATTAAADSGSAGAFAGFFAEGGDVTPGGSFISGEAGAERVDLSAGGAHITPLGGKSGGDTHNNYDLRGAVVTDDLLRKAEGAQMMRASEDRSVARAVSMQSEISKRSRPAR